MIPRDELATRHRFGRVARIPTPTPLGVGDIDRQLLLELAKRLFPKVSETQVYLVMFEGVGHLDMLVDEGKLVLEECRGVELARAA